MQQRSSKHGRLLRMERVWATGIIKVYHVDVALLGLAGNRDWGLGIGQPAKKMKGQTRV